MSANRATLTGVELHMHNAVDGKPVYNQYQVFWGEKKWDQRRNNMPIVLPEAVSVLTENNRAISIQIYIYIFPLDKSGKSPGVTHSKQ